MRHDIYRQLALNTKLLPDHLSASIIAGKSPPLADIILALVISCLDCEAAISSDKVSTWNERRLAREILAVSFLTALLFDGSTGPGNVDAKATALESKL